MERNVNLHVVAIEFAQVICDTESHDNLAVLDRVAEGLSYERLLFTAGQDVHGLEKGTRLRATNMIQ